MGRGLMQVAPTYQDWSAAEAVPARIRQIPVRKGVIDGNHFIEMSGFKAEKQMINRLSAPR
jgi:hypothetical protein